MAIAFALLAGVVIGILIAVLTLYLLPDESSQQPNRRYMIMSNYVIPDDQPDAAFSFEVTAEDAEGNPITDPAQLASLKREIINSNPAAFDMIQDTANPDHGTYHVGQPGQCNITVNLKDADGNLLATNTDGFTVTTGKVKLGSVKTTFAGLTPSE